MKFLPVILDEVKLYFKENSYSEISAVKFFNYYSVANWMDSKNNPVLNWKQKAQSVWFKPENEIITESKQPAKQMLPR